MSKSKTGQTGKYHKVLRKIVVNDITYFYMRKNGSNVVFKDKKEWFNAESDKPGELRLEILKYVKDDKVG